MNSTLGVREPHASHLLGLDFHTDCALLRCSADVRRRYAALNLVYGFYDLVGTASRLEFGRRLVFCNSELDWFARLFCPDAATRADASPLRADLPDDLPPALFSVGTCDALLDDTLSWPGGGRRQAT